MSKEAFNLQKNDNNNNYDMYNNYDTDQCSKSIVREAIQHQ